MTFEETVERIRLLLKFKTGDTWQVSNVERPGGEYEGGVALEHCTRTVWYWRSPGKIVEWLELSKDAVEFSRRMGIYT